MYELVEKFVQDIRKEMFQSWYDDAGFLLPVIDARVREGEQYMLMINTFSHPFDIVLYDDSLQELSNYLNDYISSLDNKYEHRSNYENLISKKNKLVAFRGWWYDGENNYFYEGIIIRANKLK